MPFFVLDLPLILDEAPDKRRARRWAAMDKLTYSLARLGERYTYPLDDNVRREQQLEYATAALESAARAGVELVIREDCLFGETRR